MSKIKSGFYRVYIKIPFINYGIKIPKIKLSYTIPFVVFLCGIIMNINERKRYKYYCLGKKFWQWESYWKYDGKPLPLCPTYFSLFGLLNIVKHIEIYDGEKIMEPKDFGFLSNDMKNKNFGVLENGTVVSLDYGDFNVDRMDNTLVGLIDYK